MGVENNKEPHMSTNAQLQPAAAATLQRWHQMIASNDLQALPELLHEQAGHIRLIRVLPWSA